MAFALLFQRHQSTGHTLLPALHDLTVNLQDFTGLAVFPRLVIGPNVRSVTVQVKDIYEDYGEGSDDDSDDSMQWDNVAAVLAPYASTLTHFEMIHVESYKSPESIMDLYRSFQCLTALGGAFGLTHDVFQHLATLPLKSLNCTMTSANSNEPTLRAHQEKLT